MKRIVRIVSLICLTILCASYKPVETAVKPIVLLKVMVLDDTGNPVGKAKIRLYSSKTDFDFDENPVVEGETNDKGKATFKGLDAKSYFVKAWKGDLVSPETGLKTRTLQKNNVNKINVIISESNGMTIPEVKKNGK